MGYYLVHAPFCLIKRQSQSYLLLQSCVNGSQQHVHGAPDSTNIAYTKHTAPICLRPGRDGQQVSGAWLRALSVLRPLIGACEMTLGGVSSHRSLGFGHKYEYTMSCWILAKNTSSSNPLNSWGRP